MIRPTTRNTTRNRIIYKGLLKFKFFLNNRKQYAVTRKRFESLTNYLPPYHGQFSVPNPKPMSKSQPKISQNRIITGDSGIRSGVVQKLLVRRQYQNIIKSKHSQFPEVKLTVKYQNKIYLKSCKFLIWGPWFLILTRVFNV